MTDLSTIKSWFRRGMKPTAAQFSAAFDSFWHKAEGIAISAINGLAPALAGKANIGHTHTLAEITDYNGQEKEVINCRVATTQEELDAMTREDGKMYILLSTGVLYECTYNEEADEYTLAEATPSGDVVYNAEDASNELHIYLYNEDTMVFQDATGQVVDKTIYVSDLDSLLSRQLDKGIYTVVHITTGDDNNTYGDAYQLTVGDGSIISRTLEYRSGWAQAVLLDDEYQWEWHEYAYKGHKHEMSDVTGLSDALANKAAVTHSHTVEEVTGLEQRLTAKAELQHLHEMSEINGLVTAMAGKAAADHTHNQYLTEHQDISGKQDKEDNSLTTTSKTIVGAINEVWAWIQTKVTELTAAIDALLFQTSVTYAELVALRNAGTLRPGRRYRITDFVTTTTQFDTRSAGHPFDVIVTADSSDTLNENACAGIHAGDTYFAQSKLYAWRLKYCLDNDASRFAGADTANGKGMIYYMEDEFGNKGDFDFKNIQHKRYRVTDDSADGILGSLDGQYVGFDAEMRDLIIEDYDDYIWAYAASMPNYTLDENTSELTLDMTNQQDATLNRLPEGTGIDADGGGYAHPIIFCKGNYFPSHQVAVCLDGGEWTYPQRISDIVLFCYPHYFEGEDNIPARVEFENSADNIFAPDCDYITSAVTFARNTFLTASTNMIFGGSVGRCVFKGDCSYCTFGGGLSSCTFGGYIDWCTFGGYLGDCTFGGRLYECTFGGNLSNAHIHGYLHSLTLGAAGETWENLVIDPGIENVIVTCTESGSSNVKNVHIYSGVCGTQTNKLTVSIPTRNNTLMEVKPTSKTEILV